MTAVWAFLRTPLGRWIAAGVVAALIVVWGVSRHGRAVDGVRQDAIEARDEMWRGKLQAAETAARDTIRRKESAAYQRGVEDEAKRQALDAADAEKTETVVKEIVNVSPSAAACRFDDRTVDALNGLRRDQ